MLIVLIDAWVFGVDTSRPFFDHLTCFIYLDCSVLLIEISPFEGDYLSFHAVDFVLKLTV